MNMETDLPQTHKISIAVEELERRAQCYNVAVRENERLRDEIERNNARAAEEIRQLVGALGSCFYVLEKYRDEIDCIRERRFTIKLLIKYGECSADCLSAKELLNDRKLI